MSVHFCLSVDVARAATVAHYLALRGNESVLRAARDVFHTKAVLEGISGQPCGDSMKEHGKPRY